MKFVIAFAVSMMVVLGGTQAQAQDAASRLGDCLVQSSTGAQRLSLARWIAFAVIAHPRVRDSVAVPVQVVDETDREIAKAFTDLLGVSCRSEARDAMQAGGRSFEDAFDVLGRIAMQELMSNKDVEMRIEGFIPYLNEDDFLFLNR